MPSIRINRENRFEVGNFFQVLPGDIDGDRDIDSTDIQHLRGGGVGVCAFGIANGCLLEAGWTGGDFDGDNDFDSTDVQLILATALFNKGPYAANATPAGSPGDDVMDLVVHADGTAVIDTNGVPITGFVVKSLGGHLNPDLGTTFNQDDPGLPLSGFSGSSETEASAQFFNMSLFTNGAITGIINLGQFFLPDGSVADLRDLDITYTILDSTGVFDGDCIGCVPEPSSIVLLVMGLAGLWMIRRRRS